MMAAGIVSERKKKVALLEKNPVLGKKLLISGKGRCNITNYCEVTDLIANIPTNGKFLTNSFYRFSAFDTINFFEKRGLSVKVERGNRVFPISDKASDVVKILEKTMRQNGVEIIHERVVEIDKNDKFYVRTEKHDFTAEKVILTTGGKSFPGTGSTGDGYKFAANFGHKIIAPKAALVPMEAQFFLKPGADFQINEKLSVSDLQGLSLKNVRIEIKDKFHKKIYDDFGEMLFTHFGVSGPIILSASSHMKKIDNHLLVIDLKPALTEEQLDKRILRDFSANQNKEFENVLKLLLPRKIIPVILELSGIPSNKKVNQITHVERKKLGFILKHFTILLKKFRSLKEAIVTSGGIDVKEINPKTMESKIVKGLFFAGEIIDVDGYTGGFNLQIAWSTAFVAGKNC